jgi:hypothetical protein
VSKAPREERVWWMTLLLADTVSEIRHREGDIDASLAAMRVGNRARRKLVDEFGANLDELDGEARGRFEEMFLEEQHKDDLEREHHATTDRLLKEVEALLGKK